MLGANTANLKTAELFTLTNEKLSDLHTQPESETIHFVAFYTQKIQMIAYIKVVILQPSGGRRFLERI